MRQISDDTYTPTTATTTSANEEELNVPVTNTVNVTEFETLNDGNNMIPDSNVSADQIYSKFHEYDLIENQMAKIQEQGIQVQQSIVNDKKQLKRQIKQIERAQHDSDDTSTDDYKELSSTTNSDALTSDIGAIYKKRVVPWYKDSKKLMVGIVGIGIVSFVFYKYISKSNTNGQFKWLQNTKAQSKNSLLSFSFW